MKSRLFRNTLLSYGLVTLILLQMPALANAKSHHAMTAASDVTAKSVPHNPIIEAANRQQDAFDAALNVATPGPAKIDMGSEGILDLPENYFFIPPTEAANLMHIIGNKTGSDFVGLVIPKDHIHWFITVDFVNAGFIKDTAARYWQTERLLSDLQQSTTEENTLNGNQYRLDSWLESPKYDPIRHELLWAASAKIPNDSTDNYHRSVNYNAYLLGRDGFFNLSLITSDAKLSDDKVHVKTLLSALHYLPGKRYEDFNKRTDVTADYDITTIITNRVQHVSLLAVGSFIIMKTWRTLLLSFALWLVIASRLYQFKLNKKTKIATLENEN